MVICGENLSIVSMYLVRVRLNGEIISLKKLHEHELGVALQSVKRAEEQSEDMMVVSRNQALVCECVS